MPSTGPPVEPIGEHPKFSGPGCVATGRETGSAR